MIVCPFCQSPDIRVVSYDRADHDAVIHCLNCDEMVTIAVDDHEDDLQDLGGV